jgi:hypothetical protein
MSNNTAPSSNPFKKASRVNHRLKIVLSGPSGSGKTMSALRLAHGLADDPDKIFLIDTENGSSTLYSERLQFLIAEMKPPYHPERFVKAIKLAEDAGAQVIIIDSASHEWEGEGGILDLQQKMGGQFSDWKKVNPLHKQFIDAILHSKSHVIITLRKKQDYVIEQNERGKNAPKKVGLKDVQREGFEYEFTAALDVDMNHNATASKDRTGLFMSENISIPFLITEETGKKLKDWNNLAPKEGN